MPTDRIGTYRRLLDEVRAELGTKRAAAEDLARELSQLEVQERHLSELCEDTSPATKPDRPVNARNVGPSAHASFSSQVRRIAQEAIKDAGRPLTRSDILAAVRIAGITLPSRHPEKKISKILSADKEGFRNHGAGYELND